MRAQRPVVLHGEGRDRDSLRVQLDTRNWQSIGRVDERLSLSARELRERVQRRREKVHARIGRRAARHCRNELEIIDNDHAVGGQHPLQHRIHGLIECERMPVYRRLDELARGRVCATHARMQRAQHRALADAMPADQHGHVMCRKRLLQAR
jgi:hypothetical protein